jgi:hypothetical protein
MQNEDKQLHIRLPEEIYKKLKVKCVYEDTSIQNYVANLVAESVGEYSVEEQPARESVSKKSKGRR